MEQEKHKKTPEEKAEIKRMLRTVLLALLACAAIIFVSVFYLSNKAANEEPQVKKEEVTDLESITLSSKAVAIPYVKTDIDSVVYTANTASEIVFFEFNGKEYLPVEETGHIDVTLTLSNQQIPVRIHYIQREEKLTGYGVFTARDDDSVYIYDYLLCKITALPKGFEKEGKCLLLVNTDIKNVYSLNPVWEEAFELDMSSGATAVFFSQGNRMLDINGALRSDFSLVTDAELKEVGGSLPFFTRRAYEISDSEDALYDIYLKTGSNETLAVEKVIDKYAGITADGGFVFLQNINGGFASQRYLNGEVATLKEYYSEYGDTYIRGGDWLLCKEDGRVYSLLEDKVIELPEFKMNPSLFAVSPDGKYIVLAGTVTNVFDYQIYIYNTQTGHFKSFQDADYSVHYSLFFASNTSVCFYTESADGYVEKVVDLSRIS